LNVAEEGGTWAFFEDPTEVRDSSVVWVPSPSALLIAVIGPLKAVDGMPSEVIPSV
jgi:hypothetical protein